MLFNSIDFMFFFPLVLLVYFVIPRKCRRYWLLIASYYFYMSWNPKYALLILFSTIVTYACGLLIGKEAEGKNRIAIKNGLVACCIIVNLLILGYFKYFDFMLSSISAVLKVVGITVLPPQLDILLPVGISFYTFQALSYTIDVYRNDIPAEKNFIRYALFVSFFPQLVAGPIERSKNLLSQMQNIEKIRLWDGKRVVQGAYYMLWGYFLKMVIADRASILVDEVFDHYYLYGTFELILGAFWFAVQIYCDFGGYSMIAIGAAKVMGFSLMENFNAPYLAMSVKEFWRRWHISLSSWFKDYVYIPLGGNRKGTIRKYVNLFITFLVSGLWHGAAWSYVVWGGLHGIYQIIGDLISPIKKSACRLFGIRETSFSHKIINIIGTFLLVDFAWIFFRADSVSIAFAYIGRILTKWNPWVLFDGSVYNIALDRTEMKILVLATVVLLIADALKLHFKKNITDIIQLQDTWFSWGCAIAIFMSIVIWGVYGPAYDAAQFIYFQF